MMLRSHPPSQIKYRSICSISDGTVLVEKIQEDSVLLFVPMNSKPLLTPAWGQTQLEVTHPREQAAGGCSWDCSAA